jgi:hypothetical protein
MVQHGEMKIGAATDDSTPVSDPPNVGLGAWLQVLGGHFLFFNSW